MKNYFTWTVLVLLTVSISLNLMSFSSSTSQDSTADEHILVEIYEVPAYSDKGIHIHYGGNKTELIPFHDFEKRLTDILVSETSPRNADCSFFIDVDVDIIL